MRYTQLMKGLFITALLIMMNAGHAQSTLWHAGIGTASGIAVEVIKVTTTPPVTVDNVEDTNGPVGGAQVSIYVKILYGNNVSGIDAVNVNIYEFGHTTPVTTIALNSLTQLPSTGSGDYLVQESVYTGTWNSLTKNQLIYNDYYTFQATASYSMTNIGSGINTQSDIVIVPVKNLVISSIAANNPASQSSNPDEYFVVLPGQRQHVQFNIELDDYSMTRSYSYQLTISRTMDNQTIVKHITLPGTGLSMVMDWDLTDDNNQPAAPNGGYCTYDLSVTADTDTVNYRSTVLSITNDDIALATDSNGNVCRDSAGNCTALVKYQLSEMPYSGSLKIEFLENLVEKSTLSGMSLQEQGYNSAVLNVSIQLDPPPTIRSIYCALDTNAMDYREKQPRRMLCANSGWAGYTHNILLTFGLVGAGHNPGYLTEWQWVYGLPTDLGGALLIRILHTWLVAIGKRTHPVEP